MKIELTDKQANFIKGVLTEVQISGKSSPEVIQLFAEVVGVFRTLPTPSGTDTVAGD